MAVEILSLPPSEIAPVPGQLDTHYHRFMNLLVESGFATTRTPPSTEKHSDVRYRIGIMKRKELEGVEFPEPFSAAPWLGKQLLAKPHVREQNLLNPRIELIFRWKTHEDLRLYRQVSLFPSTRNDQGQFLLMDFQRPNTQLDNSFPEANRILTERRARHQELLPADARLLSEIYTTFCGVLLDPPPNPPIQ